MSWAAVIVGGATLVGGAIAGEGAKDAARAQGRSGDAAIDEQRRQFDTMLNLTSNQRQIGNQALNTLGGIYGYLPAPGFSNEEYDVTGGVNELRSAQPVMIGDTEMPPGTRVEHIEKGWYNVYFGDQRIGTLRPGGRAGRFLNDSGVDVNALWKEWEDGQMRARPSSAGTYEVGEDGTTRAVPDYSSFYESPDYRFRLGEGLNAVQGSAAAQGGLYSGNALRSINDYGSGVAAGEFGNYVNRQLALAGMGQTATTQAGNAAMTTGANVGNLLIGQGNARASGIIGQTNAVTGGINDLASLYGMWRGGYFDSQRGQTQIGSVPHIGGR